MTIRPKVSDGTAVLEMAGTIAPGDFTLLHQHLLRLLGSCHKRIVLDFRAVDHVDYEGAKRLAREVEVVRSYNGDLRMAGLSPYLRNIFTFAGLEVILEMCARDPEVAARLEPAH